MIKLFSLKQTKKDGQSLKTSNQKITSTAQLRITKDISKLNLPKTCNTEFPDPDDLLTFKLIICPDEGFYNGGRFVFSFKVGPNYPHEPPKVKCEIQVYHPNIDLEGNVCLNILREVWKRVILNTTSFARVLKELELTSRKNVVIFAETREECILATHACFKQSLTIVTIYSTLGDEAIAHGINETEVNTVITNNELLLKFKRILLKTPEVKTIIYMEDQLKATEISGYKENVKIISFKDVIKTGNSSSATLLSSKTD